MKRTKTGIFWNINGIYYRHQGHKEFIPDKAMDEEYYQWLCKKEKASIFNPIQHIN